MVIVECVFMGGFSGIGVGSNEVREGGGAGRAAVWIRPPQTTAFHRHNSTTPFHCPPRVWAPEQNRSRGSFPAKKKKKKGEEEEEEEKLKKRKEGEKKDPPPPHPKKKRLVVIVYHHPRGQSVNLWVITLDLTTVRQQSQRQRARAK